MNTVVMACRHELAMSAGAARRLAGPDGRSIYLCGDCAAVQARRHRADRAEILAGAPAVSGPAAAVRDQMVESWVLRLLETWARQELRYQSTRRGRAGLASARPALRAALIAAVQAADDGWLLRYAAAIRRDPAGMLISLIPADDPGRPTTPIVWQPDHDALIGGIPTRPAAEIEEPIPGGHLPVTPRIVVTDILAGHPDLEAAVLLDAYLNALDAVLSTAGIRLVGADGAWTAHPDTPDPGGQIRLALADPGVLDAALRAAYGQTPTTEHDEAGTR